MPTTHRCRGVPEQILFVFVMFWSRGWSRGWPALSDMQVHYAAKMGDLKLETLIPFITTYKLKKLPEVSSALCQSYALSPVTYFPLFAVFNDRRVPLLCYSALSRACFVSLASCWPCTRVNITLFGPMLRLLPHLSKECTDVLRVTIQPTS